MYPASEPRHSGIPATTPGATAHGRREAVLVIGENRRHIADKVRCADTDGESVFEQKRAYLIDDGRLA
jgi:hypothetical protein